MTTTPTLQQHARALMTKAIAPGTRPVYESAWRLFTSFATQQGLAQSIGLMSPFAREGLLVMFATFCFTHLKCSFATIRLYLSTIKYHCMMLYGFDPFIHPNGQHFFQLRMLMTGIRKSPNNKSQPRLPITIPIITSLISSLNKGFFNPYIDLLLSSVFTLAFFGFLRCGEYTTSSMTFDPKVNLSLRDITFHHPQNDKPHFTLYLRSSKTDKFNQGVLITLYATGNDICPFKAMQAYLQERRKLNTSLLSPLFLVPPDMPLTRHAFTSFLDSMLVALRLPSSTIRPHSFRIGAATEAARMGIQDHLIKVLGRWASSCYMTYIRTPKSVIREAQSKLSQG